MSYTYAPRRKRQTIPVIWRIILGLQAAMTAWIGFTHGSGIEVYLFRFAQWNYKAVWSLDHNMATAIAVLGLIVLFRGWGFFLALLSLLYLTETMLMSRFGGYVDNPYPLLGSAVHIVLPLAVLAFHNHRWAYRLLQLSIFACLLSYFVYFFTAPQYFIDLIIQTHYNLGGESMLSTQSAYITLITLGVLIIASFFAPTRTALMMILVGTLSIYLTVDTAARFGFWYLPESLLKLTLLFGVILQWQLDPERSGVKRFPTLGGTYA
ncbi:MAG: hypothetical protein EOP10_07005 [Proteobacteria bacterium]|nr:MAG: hypothetical protein EOP10_07005 [Pseudomonadota bacterium]